MNIFRLFKIEKRFVLNKNLTEQDVKLIIHIINYGWHRAKCHNTPLTCRVKDIDKLRLSLGIINKSKYEIQSR